MDWIGHVKCAREKDCHSQGFVLEPLRGLDSLTPRTYHFVHGTRRRSRVPSSGAQLRYGITPLFVFQGVAPGAAPVAWSIRAFGVGRLHVEPKGIHPHPGCPKWIFG